MDNIFKEKYSKLNIDKRLIIQNCFLVLFFISNYIAVYLSSFIVNGTSYIFLFMYVYCLNINHKIHVDTLNYFIEQYKNIFKRQKEWLDKVKSMNK